MTDIYIDLPRAVELVLGEIAKKAEGYRYRDGVPADIGCVNVFTIEDENGVSYEPGCLVGSAVISAGVPIMDIVDSGSGGASVWGLFDHLCSFYRGSDRRIGASNSAMTYLRLVQSEQDFGGTWSESHMIALECLLAEFNELLSDADRVWLGDRSLQQDESM